MRALLTGCALLLVVAVAGCSGASAPGFPSPSSSPLLPQATAPPRSTSLPASTVSGTLAFTRVVKPGPGGDADIYLVRADGSRLERLTDGPGWEGDPSWTADGRTIVYDRARIGSTEVTDFGIWSMNSDGSEQVRLTGFGKGFYPQPSPDGRRIAFQRYLPAEVEGSVWVMNSDGSRRRLLRADNGIAGRLPAWASNDTILFLEDGDIHSIGVDGDGVRRLTKTADIDEFSLSPDGKQLVLFKADEDELILSSIKTGETLALVIDNAHLLDIVVPNVASAWRSDGKMLAVAASERGGLYASHLYIVDPDGTGLCTLPDIEGLDPAWRPR